MNTFTRLIGLPGLSNVGVVATIILIEWGDEKEYTDIFRGAAPSDPEGYETLKEMGVKTVLNLRSHSERAAVKKAGMESIQYPFGVNALLIKMIPHKKLDEIVGVMRDPVNQPVYVHCRQGHDRTGVICAAYRIAVDGWSIEDAIEEMQSYGFNDLWYKLRESLEAYAGRVKG